MSNQTPSKQVKSVHEGRAANRLIKQGKTIEEVNKYLRETPHEQMVKENVDYESKIPGNQ